MKFYSRIALFAIIIFVGTGIVIKKMYYQFPYKSITTVNYKNDFGYRIGYFIGYYTFIILGSLLIIAGIAGLLYTYKKFKNKK